MKIYLARPITGCSYQDVARYYQQAFDALTFWGYDVMVPMVCKGYLGEEQGPLKATGYKQPLSTDHAIYTRDKWMVERANIVYANLTGASVVSIGTMMEIAWAADRSKHVVVAMEPGNLHQHAFVREAANVVMESHEHVLAYLEKLIAMDLG